MSVCAQLVALRTRSLRRGIWYTALNRLERAQVDVTLRVVQMVRSPCLARVLNMIIDKLSAALQSRVAMAVQSVGFAVAAQLSSIAQGWGLASARSWARDPRFARFLAIMDLNSHHVGSR